MDGMQNTHFLRYAIAGQYDTGTNLLQKLIGAHLKTAVRVTQEAHKKADAGHYLWKHTKPENISQEVRLCSAPCFRLSPAQTREHGSEGVRLRASEILSACSLFAAAFLTAS